MKALEKKYGTVFVAAAGNINDEVRDVPALFVTTIPNMLVVGGSTKDGIKTPGSNWGDLVSVYAPGNDLEYPPGWPHEKKPEGVVGTSFGKLLRPVMPLTLPYTGSKTVLTSLAALKLHHRLQDLWLTSEAIQA